jgi:uncharacterized protein involved in oxidation of intracellular sulfur
MITVILNDPPYGTERSYNGLRLALALAKTGEEVQVFLMADAIFCGLENQKTPDGYYNVGRMIKGLLKRGGRVHTCGSCCDARGVSEAQLIDGATKSNMDTLAQWVSQSSKSLVF